MLCNILYYDDFNTYGICNTISFTSIDTVFSLLVLSIFSLQGLLNLEIKCKFLAF